uniref:Metalloendopeptidase n=1 Tax=Oncocephalus sp. TaxID=2944721 RepID=A0AB38ZEU7_9HEMI
MASLKVLTIFVSITLAIGKPIDKTGFELVCPENEKECIITGHQEFDEDHMIEGDIIPEEQPSGQSRNALMDPFTRWPKRTVPYVFHKEFNEKEKQIIENGMRFIESKTCLKFIPYHPKMQLQGVLMITNANGCRATIGYAKGRRLLNLSPRHCLGRPGKVHHEMLHVLGLKHEHSRPDRDQYVTIIQENIAPGKEHNFIKASPLEYTTYNVPYNFLSVMHYPVVAFSKDNRSPTIVPKHPVDMKKMGQRVSATDLDLKKINLMYKCPGKL